MRDTYPLVHNSAYMVTSPGDAPQNITRDSDFWEGQASGIRRLLLLSYLRAEAERRINQSPSSNIIYAIEEPETAQHPDYQRKIMESLISLSENPMHQIIITTHTPEIDLRDYYDSWGVDLDIPKLLTPKIGKTLGKDEGEREKQIKMILNGSIMKSCTYEMIQQMGNVEEITKWFVAIRNSIL